MPSFCFSKSHIAQAGFEFLIPLPQPMIAGITGLYQYAILWLKFLILK